MELLGPDLFTVKQLLKRWGKKDPKTIWRMAKRYDSVLKPIRIGGSLLFYPENIEEFENNMRVKKTTPAS